MQWEIDVFGRVKARREVGKAGADVAQADLTAAHISLAANVAKAYFNLRSVQAQLAATREAEQSQSKIADMTQVRFEVGLVSRLDAAQANTVLLSTRAAVPSLEALERCAINTLAMLTASFPAEISDSLSVAAPLPNPFQTVGLGVPADLQKGARPERRGSHSRRRPLQTGPYILCRRGYRTDQQHELPQHPHHGYSRRPRQPRADIRGARR